MHVLVFGNYFSFYIFYWSNSHFHFYFIFIFFIKKFMMKHQQKLDLPLFRLLLLKVHVCWFFNWISRSIMIVFIIDFEVVNTNWRQNPIALEHVFFFFFPSVCIWHLSIFGQTTCPYIIRDVHLWGQKQQHNNHNFKHLYSMFVNHHICVVLWSSVLHIGSWNHPKSMHKPK